MSKLTGEVIKINKPESGNDGLSGRPEGVSVEDWKMILDAARNQVIAERPDVKEASLIGNMREGGSGENILMDVSPTSELQKGGVVLDQLAETNKGVADVRKEILEKALNMLNGGASTEVIVNNPDGVADFVDSLYGIRRSHLDPTIPPNKN